MTDGVLYFPSIRVPETEWFTRVLLYWDTVGTIVPAEYLDDPKFLRPYTTGLKDHGLLKVITPDSIWYEIGAQNYRESFLALVDSLTLKRDDIPLNQRERVRVHVDKTGSGLAYELIGRELAAYVSGPEWDGWYEIEKTTADLFMAYLATILGQNAAHPMTPITDSADCLQVFDTLPFERSDAEARANTIRTELIADILPAPVDPVSPADLARFRERHRDLLVRFRTSVEQCMIAAATIDDAKLRARKVNLDRNAMKSDLDEILRRMQENKWRHGFGTLIAMAASAVAAADIAP